jgi:hypothetical protein
MLPFPIGAKFWCIVIHDSIYGTMSTRAQKVKKRTNRINTVARNCGHIVCTSVHPTGVCVMYVCLCHQGEEYLIESLCG